MNRDDARKHYDSDMPKKFGDDYEFRRWHETPIKEAGYGATLDAVTRHVLEDPTLSPKRILELGPGAGTWTRFLLGRFPDAHFDLVDISEQMIERSRRALGEPNNVQYVVSDIFDHTAEPYDFIFSSRVLEYIPEKAEFAEKVSDLLVSGGRGFVITKMPHYGRAALAGRTFSAFHQGQIAPEMLGKFLDQAGIAVDGVHPVTVSVPGLRIAPLNRAIAKMLSGGSVNPLSSALLESYALSISKRDVP